MTEEHKKHPVRYVTDLLCEMVIQLSETKDELSETRQQLEQAEKEKSQMFQEYMDYRTEVHRKLDEIEKEATENRQTLGRIQQYIDNHNNMPASEDTPSPAVVLVGQTYGDITRILKDKAKED